MLPAETLNANGTVNQASIGVGGRGSDIFATYTTLGTPGGETWQPKFNYFAMQYLQVTGLPGRLHPDHGPDPRPAGVRRRARAPATSRPPTRASTGCTTCPCTRSRATDVDVHGLPGPREAALRRRLRAADGLAERQLRLRRLPAQHGGPARRGPVQAGRRRRQRGAQDAGLRLGLLRPVRRRDQLGLLDRAGAVAAVQALRRHADDA